ncbi:MAG: MarR family winged helix-turn-helix transcriptional regulator [Thermoplasmata archaeon]|nr:MarR family winged helix-turn-helix transcriptional regulator [Thermoplasmata archaeon]
MPTARKPEPSPSRDQLLLDAMRVATFSFKRWVSEVLTDRSMTMGQFWTLSDIGDHEPVNAAHLASLRCVTPPTVSVIVEELVQEKLVARSPSRTDRRVVVLSLTPRGRETVVTVWKHIGSRLSEATRPLPLRDIESAVRVLNALETPARPVAVAGGAA